MGDVMGLIRLLRRENVQVRLGRSRFNHAKCYILGQEGAVIGSSNFTGAGLSKNDELNVRHLRHVHLEEGTGLVREDVGRRQGRQSRDAAGAGAVEVRRARNAV